VVVGLRDVRLGDVHVQEVLQRGVFLGSAVGETVLLVVGDFALLLLKVQLFDQRGIF